MVGLEPTTLGSQREVSLIYGTCQICLWKARRQAKRHYTLLYRLSYMELLPTAGLEPATHGLTGEVSLIYGTC